MTDPHPFSPAGRAAALEGMADGELDLLVIGGGITGCGVARDAALRGLRVGLVEKADFGYGTSSRSTKIVHGGIRYLAYGHVRLVREAALERKRLRRIAPHLVHPLPFVYALYEGESKLKFRSGFWVFDRLAGAARQEKHRFLTPEEVRAAAPALRDPLKGGVVYMEYVTDDARLTMENALAAALHGALVANHAEAVSAVRAGARRDGRVMGARVLDVLTGQEREVRARVVLNATGAWAPELIRRAGDEPAKRLVASKGIHLLFHADRLPIASALHLRTPGGREGLAIRRWDYVYVGTSDVEYGGDLDEAAADRPAVEDVLRMARECFPALALDESDILACWAGLRPLIAAPGKSTREMSRHDEIWEGPRGLLTIAGGKLTTYRAMADRALRRVGQLLGRDLGDDRRSAEDQLPGAWGGDGDGEADGAAALGGDLEARGVSAATAARIVWLYGSRARELLRYGREEPRWLEPLAPDVPAIRGEARLAVEQEMASTLADFMDRRASLLLFSPGHGLGGAGQAASILGDILGWTPEERDRQLESYRRLARRHAPPARG